MKKPCKEAVEKVKNFLKFEKVSVSSLTILVYEV
jgi:hypothetical protein